MHALTFPLLRRLSDGNFHSGEALAAHFGVSRASIWHALKDLDTYGVALFKVRGRGYRLPHAIDWLDVGEIAAGLGQDCHVALEVRDVVDSTNSLLMQRAAHATAQAECMAAELQTHGRGRRGRVWHAPIGGALTFSVLWKFPQGAAQLSGLSLAVGVALIRALHEIGMQRAQLKWPNDLLIDYRKLGGILVELQGEAMGPSSTVIGVGLNLRLTEQFKHRIDQAVIDLASRQAAPITRNALLAHLLRHLIGTLQVFEQQGFAALQQEWQTYHAYQGREVVLHLPQGSSLRGRVKGVASDGCLILETPQGEQRFGNGEVSLRPPQAKLASVLE